MHTCHIHVLYMSMHMSMTLDRRASEPRPTRRAVGRSVEPVELPTHTTLSLLHASTHVLAMPLLVLLAAIATPAGNPSDVKYIRCAACEALVDAVRARAATLPKSGTESDFQKIVDDACNPESVGEWMSFYDLVEDRDRLQLVKQAEDGPCGKECQTVALACRALLEEGWENELGESLYTSFKAMSKKPMAAKKNSEDEGAKLRETVCRGWSSACKRPPPPLDARARPPGPSFRPYTDEERAARAEHSGTPPAPGVLSEGELAKRCGADEPSSEKFPDGAWPPDGDADKKQIADLARKSAFVKAQW